MHMAMLDNTDIDFSDTPGSPFKRRAELPLRRVTKTDLVAYALILALGIALIVYQLWRASHTDPYFYVFIGFWLIVFYPSLRDFRKLIQKYRSGEKIRAGYVGIIAILTDYWGTRSKHE